MAASSHCGFGSFDGPRSCRSDRSRDGRAEILPTYRRYDARLAAPPAPTQLWPSVLNSPSDFSRKRLYCYQESKVAEYILSDYIDKALSQAVYEKLEDETYAGKIPVCTGVIAFGNTLRECENELHSTLEDWVFVGLKKSHELPIIDDIDLNKEIIREPMETL